MFCDEAQLLVNKVFFNDNIKSLKEKKRIANNDTEKKHLKSQIKMAEASAKKSDVAYKEISKLIDDANDLLNGKVKKREDHMSKLIVQTEIPSNIDSGMGGTIIKNDLKIQNNTRRSI